MGSLTRLVWLPRSWVIYFSCDGIIRMPHHGQLFKCSWRYNLESQACKASILLTEPSPPPLDFECQTTASVSTKCSGEFGEMIRAVL